MLPILKDKQHSYKQNKIKWTLYLKHLPNFTHVQSQKHDWIWNISFI